MQNLNLPLACALLLCVSCILDDSPPTVLAFSRFNEETHLAIAKSTFKSPSYSRQAIPVKNHSEPLVVYVGMGLRKILEVDEFRQLVRFSLWIREYWVDEFITWNPESYGGMSTLRVEHGSVWNPDLVLYTNGGDDQEPLEHINLIVDSNGQITYTYPAIYSVACHMEIQ